MPERMVTVNSVRLCVDTVGDPDHPAVLLIAGAGGSMDTWEPDFCAALAAGGRFVVRYDHRDTGRSVHYPVNAPDYSFFDLLADAAAVITEVVPAGRAHVVGMSMGGMIGQFLALTRPELVLSLAPMATTVPFPAELPGLTPELLAAYSAMVQPDWTDADELVEHLVHGHVVHAGPAGIDLAAARVQAVRIVDRAVNLEAAGNHNAMKEAEPPQPLGDLRERLSALTLPVLVLHGTADPMLTIEHGEALAAAIPGAGLLRLEGIGHQAPPRSVWDQVVPALLAHTAGAGR